MELITLDFQGTSLATPIIGGHRVVPIKTICELIDVDPKTQTNWIKKHPIFGQLGSLASLPGADGKTYKMFSLPMLDAYSWLASISENQRRDGSEQKQYAFMAWFREQMVQEYQAITVVEKTIDEERQLLEANKAEEEEIDKLKAEVRAREKAVRTRIKRIEAIRFNRVTGQVEMNLID